MSSETHLLIPSHKRGADYGSTASSQLEPQGRVAKLSSQQTPFWSFSFARYVTRVCTFQTTLESTTRGAHTLIRLWQCFQSANRRKPFNIERYNRSLKLLAEFGVSVEVDTEDGRKVQGMHFRAESFNQWMKKKNWVREGEFLTALDDESGRQLQETFPHKWFPHEERGIRIPPLYNETGRAILVIAPHGFGRKLGMEKFSILLHLLAGFDYATHDFDPSPTEGLVYRDYRAFSSNLLSLYPVQDCREVGTCAATFLIADSLLQHSLKEGRDAERTTIPAVLIHPPASMQAFIEHQGKFVSWWGKRGMEGIKGGFPDEDCFDTSSKLARSKHKGPILFIDSLADKTISPNSVPTLIVASGKAAPRERFTEEQREDDAVDAHFQDPLMNLALRERYFSFLAKPPIPRALHGEEKESKR